MRPLQQSKSCLEAHASHWPDELKGFNGFISAQPIVEPVAFVLLAVIQHCLPPHLHRAACSAHKSKRPWRLWAPGSLGRPDGVRGWGLGALHPALVIQRRARPCGSLPGKAAQRPRAAAMHR